MNPVSSLLRVALPCLAILFGIHLQAAPKLPNIIFIMVDDMGYHDLGCYGSKTILTPNIDRMAKEGLRFTDCYSGDTVCASARSTLMTGYHKGHTPVRGNSGGIPLFPNDVTVAEV
ncbi:MAG: sulfatase-like hydrolase/transferase, partial [Opitutae bacterium]|nr:sulfatase-like hydrolase/transferase [Opitutae bacterium]